MLAHIAGQIRLFMEVRHNEWLYDRHSSACGRDDIARGTYWHTKVISAYLANSPQKSPALRTFLFVCKSIKQHVWFWHFQRTCERESDMQFLLCLCVDSSSVIIYGHGHNGRLQRSLCCYATSINKFMTPPIKIDFILKQSFGEHPRAAIRK